MKNFSKSIKTKNNINAINFQAVLLTKNQLKSVKGGEDIIIEEIVIT